MNTYRFKITPVAQECRELLEMSQDVVFQGKGSVVGHNIKDNHDQSTTTTSVIKVDVIEVQAVENGSIAVPVYKGEIKKKSPSQRLREKLFILHSARGSAEDFDQYYEKTIQKILDKIDREIDDINNEGIL